MDGVDLIELRLDLMKMDPVKIFALLPDFSKCIVTCRPEGFTQEERLTWLKASIDSGASYLDLEVESSEDYATELIGHARKNGTKLIVSYHNFELTPGREDLKSMMEKCQKLGGDIAKIATRVNSRDDLGTLLSLYEIPGKKVIIGMGPMGRITRVLAPYLGSEFTFSSPGGGKDTAPGQLSATELIEIYKVIDKS